jgi:predicted Zn-dependent peptidase
MINFDKQLLENKLTVITHNDPSSSIAAVNILYNVGAKHESPDKTGFAHLFEHLMFGVSLHVSSYDTFVEKAGGTNNAFTNNDITSYYLVVPHSNIEIAYWLESDRMLGLNFSEENLKVQKNVVIEEFKQRYLNQPYGDVWLLLRPLAFTTHPYQWPTIGKDISHIENATLEEVKHFFYTHYAPNNAILTISGNVHPEQTLELAQKWFGDIPERTLQAKKIPDEPKQTAPRALEVERNVPLDAIYKVYHIFPRNHKHFYTTDMISDILSNGVSARFIQHLVKTKKLFHELEAFVSGEMEEGLFIIAGKLNEGTSMQVAEEAILNELENIKKETVTTQELNKVKHKFEANQVYKNSEILNRALQLSYFELLGDAGQINQEIENVNQVTPEQIQSVAQSVFTKENCSTLYYYSKNHKHAK